MSLIGKSTLSRKPVYFVCGLHNPVYMHACDDTNAIRLENTARKMKHRHIHKTQYETYSEASELPVLRFAETKGS